MIYVYIIIHIMQDICQKFGQDLGWLDISLSRLSRYLDIQARRTQLIYHIYHGLYENVSLRLRKSYWTCGLSGVYDKPNSTKFLVTELSCCFTSKRHRSFNERLMSRWTILICSSRQFVQVLWRQMKICRVSSHHRLKHRI